MGVCLNMEFDDIMHDYYLMHDLNDYAAFFQGAELVTTITVLGPVVQRFVSLTSSLRVISLTVLGDSIYIILIFFAEKM